MNPRVDGCYHPGQREAAARDPSADILLTASSKAMSCPEEDVGSDRCSDSIAAGKALQPSAALGGQRALHHRRRKVCSTILRQQNSCLHLDHSYVGSQFTSANISASCRRIPEAEGSRVRCWVLVSLTHGLRSVTWRADDIHDSRTMAHKERRGMK
mmetsp:Transcript_54501/g.145516  ORF Transcript_54501/g.145516 Transcript_54501/m.145516 type:complete len:156 (-) Transcript_54501:1536-2003(-)